MKSAAANPPVWFKHLSSPKDRGDTSWAFSDGGIHRKPLVDRVFRTILQGFGENDPGVRSFDKPYLLFLRQLVDNLNEDCVVGLDADNFQAPGCLHADFSNLKTPAGYSMAPMSLAPRDNEEFADSLGLPSDFHSERHRQIFDKFADLVFSKWKVTSIKTPKLSTQGAPVWMSGARMKREHAVYLLAKESEVRRLYRKGDMVALASYAKIVFMMNAGRRDQLDRIGKQREVFPLDYAISGGRSGKPIIADKTVNIDGIAYDDFSATRARLFHGAPYATNLYPQILATGILHGGLFDQFPETFHCTDVKAAIEAIPTDHDMRCSDATEYDRSMRTFLIKRFFQRARRYWSEDLIDWCEQLCFCAYFSRPVDLDDPNNPGFKKNGDANRSVLMGDIWSKKDQVRRGNPSGHAWTSLIGKFMMVFDFLATADDLMGDVLENMVKYLRHQALLMTKNNGDDGMYHGKIKVLQNYVKYRFHSKVNPGYFKLDPEIGNIWSGYVTERRPEGGFRAYQRPQTSLSKIVCPERSAGSNFRKRPTVGILQRVNGGDHPYHDRMFEIFFRTWRDVAQPVYGDFMAIVNRHHDLLEPEMQALTAIDALVLDKPELLHYQFDESDVSPNVLSMLFEQALSPAEILPFVEANFTGEIVGEVSSIIT